MGEVYRYSYESEMMKVANFRANDGEINYIGHLISGKFGDMDLAKDFSFKDPMSPSSEVEMAAVITLFRWTGEEGKAMEIIGRVTDANSSLLHAAIEDNDKTRECEVIFNIYRHKEGTTFFKTLHTDGAAIKGTIVLDASSVSNEPMRDYTQIKNYEFRVLIEGTRGVKQGVQSDRGKDMKKSLQFGNPAPVA